MWLCAGATIFDVFHRLFEFSFGESKFLTVCVSFKRQFEVFCRSFESSIGESGALVEKWKVRVEIASFCEGFDRLIAGSIVPLVKVLFAEVRSVGIS